MKKIFYIMGLVLFMASCTGDYTDWADPQSNAQGDAQSVTLTVANAAAIDYANVTADSIQLFVPTLNSSSESSSYYLVTLYNADKSSSVTLTANANGYVSADELKAAVESLYGKNPTQRSIPMDIVGYTAIDNVSVQSKANATATVTLTAPFIDSGYWLTGDFAGWNKDGALAFSHSDTDVYDDPVFTIVFTTTADNQYWKIISQTNYDGDFWAGGETGVVGVVTDGDTSMSGSLVTTSPNAGKIEKAGMYKMTINMMDYTYTIEPIDFQQFMYFIGATDGWSNAEQRLESPNYDGIYTGYLYVTDPNGWGLEFKFQYEPGNWDKQVNSNNLNSVTGDFEKGGDNIKATAGEGVYYVTLDLASGSLNAVRITNMNLVGDFNGWNAADDAQQMTWDAQNYCFVITGAGVTANGWKFTANNSWDINLGGDSNDKLVANGNNLSSVGTTIKLYPTRKNSDNIYCTVE